MIRFFNAYFPARTVLLGASEAVLTTAAFVLAIIAAMGPFDAQMFISYEQGGDRVALVVCVFVLCMYYFDLYDSTVLRSQREVFTRLIQVFGAVCIILALRVQGVSVDAATTECIYRAERSPRHR